MTTLLQNPNQSLTLAILGLTVILFISGKVRVDMVSLLVLVLLGITKVLPTDVLFSGFSSEAVIALIAVMILGKGLERSGLINTLARWIAKVGANKERKLLSVLILVSALMAAFVRSIGAIVLLLPTVNRIALRSRIAKSRLLMPIAFAAISGGTLTLIGTGPLIILNSLIEGTEEFLPQAFRYIEPFEIFEVLPIGASLLVLSLLYFIFLGRFILPQGQQKEKQPGLSSNRFRERYGLGGNIYELKLRDNSELCDKSLKQLEKKLPEGLTVVAIHVEQKTQLPPIRRTVLTSQSVLAVMGDEELARAFAKEHDCQFRDKLQLFSETLNITQVGFSEAVIPPSSQLIGAAAAEIHMRKTHGLQLLALARGEKVYRGDEIKELHFRSGDTLGIYSEWDDLALLEQNKDFVVVTSDYPKDPTRSNKLIPALLFFALAFFLLVVEHLPLPIALFFGAAGMIVTKVITIDEAYDAVSWRTVFLLAGLIPLGEALNTSGLIAHFSSYLMTWLGDWSIIAIEIALAVLTTLLALVITNLGATVLLVPLAIALAIGVGGSPRIFALIVAISASNSFLIPTHQTNALITGPGNYSVRDFIKAGGPMTLLYWLVTLTAIHCFVEA